MLCAYTRPRYQVSVYRTIGPLVSITEGKTKFNQVILGLILYLCQRSLRLCEVFSF